MNDPNGPNDPNDLLRPCVLAARHHDDVSRHVGVVRARVAAGDDRADDAPQEVAGGIDLAAARQGLPDRLGHDGTF
jgi:hypothetical protein